MKSRLQFSLCELLLIVVFSGLVLASLSIGGLVASITVFLTIVFAMRMAIVAFVGRGAPQAFAIGFLIPVISYAAVLQAIGDSELDPYEGRLPTSMLLMPVFQVMAKQTWTNTMTGEPVPDYDPADDLDAVGVAGPFGGSAVALSESPERAIFMVVGHVLFAAILGYAGAKFAVGVNGRQPESGDTDTS
jgi:hypothetical protein